MVEVGDINGETESTRVAGQDHALSINYFKKRILKEETESKCQLYKEYEETTDHLTSGCPILANDTSQDITKSEHISKAVCEHEDITVLWNQGVQTESFWPIGQT
jgi:hypothetical protein